MRLELGPASEPRALVDTAFVTLNDPFSRPLTFGLLELVVVGCAGVTLAHALRRRRAGDGGALFTWVTVFVYGLVMELLSYNLFKNFAHGQFTVMFYHRQLPLYISVLYPVLIYGSVAAVRRLGLGRAAEPFAVGLAIVALDVPFDLLGPDAGWWSWSATDPNLAYRWLGVPVTSYYWHLAFGGTLAFLTRSLERRGLARFWLALPAACVTVVVGIGLFIPFHLLKRLGVPDGPIVAGLVALALGVAVTAKRGARLPPDPLLLVAPAVFYAYHLGVAVLFASWGDGPDRLGKLAVIALVSTAAMTAHLGAQRDRARSPESPSPA